MPTLETPIEGEIINLFENCALISGKQPTLHFLKSHLSQARQIVEINPTVISRIEAMSDEVGHG